jgi:type II secretory pathway pseudopilin PulG
MDPLIVFILVAGAFAVIAAVASSRRDRRGREAQAAEQLAAVRRAADEDVTVFGEELQQLGHDLAGRELDAGAQADYQRALDSYEDAKESVQAVQQPEEVRHVTEILEDGRYAMACVQARVDDKPLPDRRPPCFFNPQHGPSVTDVVWAPPGGAQRDVPACALDAERVNAGADPDARQVMVGPRRVPYWQAGPAFAPWTAGYFGAFNILPALLVGTLVGGVMFAGEPGYEDVGSDGGDGGDGGGDGGDGGGDGGDSGGFDGGGDGGGFDGGGWDGGGGFDGGGFDGGGFDGGGF